MITISGVIGLPRIQAGDDIAALLADLICLSEGDIVVITSKIVSKAEGRLVPALNREEAIASEAQRLVARRGRTSITQTRHGFIMAAAGVDMSDVPLGYAALLPLDPDQSARDIRSRLQAHFGVTIGVIITDTFGRAWRDGLVDMAIGSAGITPTIDHRGLVDDAGNILEATVMAVVDEIAAASELVRKKLSQTPVALLQGLNEYVTNDDGPGVSALIRAAKDDWFRLGHREAITSRRTIRSFMDTPVPDEIIDLAVAAALTAPAPHHSHPLRFVRLEDRIALLTEMNQAWRADLRNSGLGTSEIDQRLLRGQILFDAPLVILPFMALDSMHHYGDQRDIYERDMFLIAGGAGVQNFLLAIHGEGLGAAWISSTIFCGALVQKMLGLDPSWQPLGAIAVGYPKEVPAERAPLTVQDYLFTDGMRAPGSTM